jgi:hypothetical protein
VSTTAFGFFLGWRYTSDNSDTSFSFGEPSYTLAEIKIRLKKLPSFFEPPTSPQFAAGQITQIEDQNITISATPETIEDVFSKTEKTLTFTVNDQTEIYYNRILKKPLIDKETDMMIIDQTVNLTIDDLSVDNHITVSTFGNEENIATSIMVINYEEPKQSIE